MLRAEESSNFSMEGFSEPNGYEADDFDEDVMIDLDLLVGDLNDDEPVQSFPEEMSERSSLNGETPCIGNQVIGARNDLLCPDALHSSYSFEVSDIRGVSGGSTMNQGINARVQSSPMNARSASLGGWISLVPANGTCSSERESFSLPGSSMTSFSQRDDDNVSSFGDKFDANIQQGESVIKLRNTATEINHEEFSKYCDPENVMDFCKHGIFLQDSIGTIGLSENNCCTSMQVPVMDVDMCSHDTMSKKSALCPSTDVMMSNSAAKYAIGADYTFVNGYDSHNNNEWTNHFKNEGEFRTESACSSTKMELNDDVGISGKSASRFSVSDYIHMEGWNYGYESNDYTSPVDYPFYYTNGFQVDEKASMHQVDFVPSYIYGEDKVKDEKPDMSMAPNMPMWHSDVNGEAVSRKHSCSAHNKNLHEETQSSLSGISSSLSGRVIPNFYKKEDHTILPEVCRPQDYSNGSSTPFNGNGHLMNAREQRSSHIQPSAPTNNHFMSDSLLVSKVSPESSHSNFSEKSVVEDDPDICIIENISHPAPVPTRQPPILGPTPITLQRSTIGASYMPGGGLKSKPKDDRLLLKLLQDITSHPKSEMSPPEGLLAVPLLQHQRIALSWMVQKETDSSRCSGGILADDQGLGKTVSTISLILKERSPSQRASPIKQKVTETLNLDDDDDIPSVSKDVKQEADGIQLGPNETQTRSKNLLGVGKGRPSAGTLIVCPTSVLRQWEEELRNKVTEKANLSVLMYHGSNRTKDPCELAKYDVVLTTYSIVSMEVPKQPRAGEDDEERGKLDEDGMPVGVSSTKKRKYPPSSDKKHSNKKASDNAVYEALARPLAKVGWFRVVLDEAQSIKNHRTQVARACWGLRAKRRWCLSGTPIQNAIDDLYSYFRFLKYDPFDEYKLFCSNIKAPINKSPTKGYQKLQTVLKTIMLRRTKGTRLPNGEPIIKLPPKHIELKKVDFSQQERDFYSKLEADSRAQFEEYAAAGTVKQNYVNILLMLLRLRQACDHPFLVRGADSSSLRASSVEIAKNLSQEQKELLLRRLEASLAICGICNDPPEDAVVAKCGHVFCNQCISEHLTGDEQQCPNTKCKTRLNVSSVFSKAALQGSPHNQSYKDSSDSAGPIVVGEPRNSCSEGSLYTSSKIKAALAVLQSLSTPMDSSSGNSSMQSMSDGLVSPMETPAAEPVENVPESQNSDIKQSSALVKVIGQKAIVFSQWTRMLDLLEACLKSSSIKYRRLDGTMSVTARDKAVKDFNTLPEVTVMIMSLKAASLGLNMVAACHVLLLDLWWNPTTEDQAIDRAHRIGQTRPVTVLRLTVKDTVEDRILALQQKKREMVASAFGEDGSGGHGTRLTVDDLRYLFMM